MRLGFLSRRPNPYRGEIAACLDGKTYILRLSLAALVELEQCYEGESITALIARFGKGGLSAKDAVHIIRAGFFGAGLEISESEIAKMQMGTTPLAALELATELLEAAFLPL